YSNIVIRSRLTDHQMIITKYIRDREHMIVRSREELLIDAVIACGGNDGTVFCIGIIDHILLGIGAGRSSPRAVHQLRAHIGGIHDPLKSEVKRSARIVAYLNWNEPSAGCYTRNTFPIIRDRIQNAGGMRPVRLLTRWTRVVIGRQAIAAAEIPAMPIIDE